MPRGRPLAAGVMGVALCGICSAPLSAHDYQTYLVDIRQGSGLSELAGSLGNGGYELSDGTWVSFRGWYDSDWQDLRIDFLTQLSENLGVLWGASTGEWGEKYTIEPSLRLGLISQVQPKPNASLSLTVTTNIGGRLLEQPCEADYGELGGIQLVNCRLAASPLQPEETLQYLLNVAPNRLNITLSYGASF